VDLKIIAAVAAVLLLVALVAFVLKQRQQRQRLLSFSSEIQRAAQDHTFEARVAAEEGSEFSELGSTVNHMLETLNSRDRASRERELLFRNLAESVPDIVLVHRDSILYANPAAANLVGTTQEELVGKPMLDLVTPEFRSVAREMTKKRLAGDEGVASQELKLVNGSDQGLWVESNGILIDYGGENAILELAVDISDRKRVLERTEEKERAWVTLESIGDGIVTTDAQGVIDYVNGAAEGLMGIDHERAVGKKLYEIISFVDEADGKSLGDPVKKCLNERRRVNLGRRALLLSHSGGGEHSVEINASPIRGKDDDVLGAVAVLHDVTEIRGLTRQMSYQASHDALTGLINRREFERRLGEQLQPAHSGEVGHVVCYLDLDRFKAVNDTCGHLAGDNMLREVAGLLRERVRDSDSVARLGGDEFGMLLVGCPLEKARQIADDVCQVVRDYRFVWRDQIFTIGVSIGLVEISHESGDVEDVLNAADSACYVAKKQGRNRIHVYSARDEAIARQRGEIQWLQRLQSALNENRFELYLQPIISLNGRVETGPALEILLRMTDEHGVQVSPSEFMRAAERYQLMSHVDRWVVQTALSALGQGTIKLPDRRSCGINLSGQTLGDEQFLEFVVDCLDRTGVDPTQVCFEVTESSVVTNLSHAQRFIGVLHGIGCRFALDDFGSGLGSFANLKNLAMDYLKIDGSFMKDLATDEVNQAMVSAMIKLARTLDFQVVAEQVEDQEAFDTVREMGVDFVQGYLVGKPQRLQP